MYSQLHITLNPTRFDSFTICPLVAQFELTEVPYALQKGDNRDCIVYIMSPLFNKLIKMLLNNLFSAT